MTTKFTNLSLEVLPVKVWSDESEPIGIAECLLTLPGGAAVILPGKIKYIVDSSRARDLRIDIVQ